LEEILSRQLLLGLLQQDCPPDHRLRKSQSIFETISKNPGIGLLCLDSDGENINMFHNPGIIGGTWFQSEQKLVSILYFHEKAIAVKIKESLIFGAN
jgi:hypothetical protein